MISEGPALIEALDAELQGALDGVLKPEDTLRIVVRGDARHALAATTERVLVLTKPVISGNGSVEVLEAPLNTLSNIRAEPRPVGGRLRWETSHAGGPTEIAYPTPEASKFTVVAKRLSEMARATGATSATLATPSTTPATTAVVGEPERLCAKCRQPLWAEDCWCTRCGLQAADPCWECGRRLPEGANFCGFCGTPNTEPAVLECPGCKALSPRGDLYCTRCGVQVRPACAECDRTMRKEWKLCPDCGGEPAWDKPEDEGEVSVPTASGRNVSLVGEFPPGTNRRTAPELNAAGAKAYEAGNYREAIRLFREATEADPRNSSYYVNLGVAYGEQGDELQAFTVYRRAVELNPQEVSAYLNMGYLYMERERTAEAREMWERVIRVAPDSDEAREARENLASAGEV